MKKIFIITFLILLFSQSNSAFATNKYYKVELPSYYGNGTYTVIHRKNNFVKDRFSKPTQGYARKKPKISNAELHKLAMHRIAQRRAYRNAKVIAFEPQNTYSKSKLHKDYYKSNQSKQISCHGVTYYSNMNVCK